MLATAIPGAHAVQFYEGERFLQRTISAFLEHGIRAGEAIAMVTRRRTFDAFADWLSSRRDVPSDALERIVFLDADATLPTVMDGQTLSAERLTRGFTDLVTRARRRNDTGTLWIYGEMVDLLCKSGNHAAALQIEEHWNTLTAGKPISSMCGYAIDDFDDDFDANTFRAICHQHTHVFPTETFIEAPDDRARLHQIALLEQRARALAHQPAIVTGPHHVINTAVIYVIDDDESMRRSLARLLAAVDFRVRTFASAEAFLAEVNPASAGLVIADAQLVGMSGSELQTRMTSANWRMPVIAMSGSFDRQIETEAMRLGAAAFLGKPFDAQALLDAIARALGG